MATPSRTLRDPRGNQERPDGSEAGHGTGDADASRSRLMVNLNQLPPCIDISTLARILGISRGAAYELARRGELPVRVIRLGRRLVIPTAELLVLLGVAQAEPAVSEGERAPHA